MTIQTCDCCKKEIIKGEWCNPDCVSSYGYFLQNELEINDLCKACFDGLQKIKKDYEIEEKKDIKKFILKKGE